MRPRSMTDQCIALLDTAVQTIFPNPARPTVRPNPSNTIPEPSLNDAQKRHAAGLMRVNHSGEVSAQALYQGQALAAGKSALRKQLLQAAAEEMDHLAWCEQRLAELDSAPSLLNPLWFGASFLVGIMAGLAGDKISLGFLAETEAQVTLHLQGHLSTLPEQDLKSRMIVEHMAIDEHQHAQSAVAQGGISLPEFVCNMMRWSAKALTKGSYLL